MENEHIEYETTQELCITCSTPIPDHLVECEECENEFYERMRPRCHECKVPVSEVENLCDECSWKFFTNDLRTLCRFSIFNRDWWDYLHDLLLFTSFKQILRYMWR